MDFAPEHNRLELEAIEAAERDRRARSAADRRVRYRVSRHPAGSGARSIPGPYEWYEQGIRRYGFHGISHQYVSRRAAEILGREPGCGW